MAPPYRAYLIILGSFAGSLAALSRQAPRKVTPWDVVLVGLASFKASRAITREKVGAVIREPFIEGEAQPGGHESPVKTGDWQQAVGELVTCSRCVGTWAAAGLVGTQAVTPRFGRLLTWTLAAGALNDWLQAGFSYLTAKASAGSSDLRK
jgi:hypothetical protein